jgi:phosphatidylserine/phosphatidylglycerophosphate/cardiolipin synthase-like enzyme
MRGAGAILRLAVVAATAALAACATLPPPVPRAPTFAYTDVEAAPLAAMVRRVLPPDGRSAFRLLPYGPNALAARLALARAATRSLDVQYYILAADDAGGALMRELRAAGGRGVRVRVLVDDLYTVGEDERLLGLASAPHVEVRLFNPFPAGRESFAGRFLASLFDFRRVDRRMHNKLFVADNVAAIAGGRNMADAYVMNAAGGNFIDLDAFAAGPVVRELSAAFDAYWNSEHVYPVQGVAASARAPAELLAAFDRDTAGAHPPPAQQVPDDGSPVRVPGGGEEIVFPAEVAGMLDLPFEIERGGLGPMLWASARVLVDPLTKTEGENQRLDSIEGTVTAGTVEWLRGAHRRIKLVSPYFVANEAGVRLLGAARQAGIEVQVVTNSLAATDEPLVYVGYRRHLRELLEMGVVVYEVSPTLSAERRRLGILGGRTGALHMKSATLDDRAVFLGSMNFDLRSSRLNTELGLIIDSPEMAAQLQAFADPGSSYLVRLGADRHTIEWVAHDGEGHEAIFHDEPETGPWTRFKLWLLGPFVSDLEL